MGPDTPHVDRCRGSCSRFRTRFQARLPCPLKADSLTTTTVEYILVDGAACTLSHGTFQCSRLQQTPFG